jgi:rare lipoprotein A
MIVEGLGDLLRAAFWTAIALLALHLFGCDMAHAKNPAHAKTRAASVWVGGRQTRAAQEEVSFYRYGPTKCGGSVGPMTAAHRFLPCGSVVRATTRYGSAVLTINDRGPYVAGRVLDVSPDAAIVLGLVGPGHLPVELTVLSYGAKEGVRHAKLRHRVIRHLHRRRLLCCTGRVSAARRRRSGQARLDGRRAAHRRRPGADR